MILKAYFKNNISDNLILLKNRMNAILSLTNSEIKCEYFYIDTENKNIIMENNQIYPEYYDDIIGNFYCLVTDKGIFYNNKLI